VSVAHERQLSLAANERHAPCAQVSAGIRTFAHGTSVAHVLRQEDMMNIRKLTAVLVTFLPLAGCAVDPTSTDDEELSTRIDGDWRDLGNGECLAAMQAFYPKKFPKDHAKVPIAGPGSYGSCAAHGACKIWEDPDTRPDSTYWERIPNDGKHGDPKLYDLIVFPPTAHDAFGHIASVDHVEDGKIFVMDSNYVHPETHSTTPHTVSWKALGWYRLKALATSPRTISCHPGGFYCGGDKVSGPHDDLMECNSKGTGVTLYKTCANGCEVRTGEDDRCL
jgi:hypothetical protein